MSTAAVKWLDRCGSTSAELAACPDAAHGTVIAARRQTAGRGQRGNSWEAESERNLTFSMLLRPASLPACRQFELSMAVALAVADSIDELLEKEGCAERTAVKWPNDIYVGDKKICGTLIENSLCGSMIERSIAGIGINVNQRKFVSDAPNPVSLIHFVGHEVPLGPFLDAVCGRILAEVDSIGATPLLERFMARLWRGQGSWPFREPGGDVFEASIVDIAPDGMMTLSNGRSYAFKEVAFVL